MVTGMQLYSRRMTPKTVESFENMMKSIAKESAKSKTLSQTTDKLVIQSPTTPYAPLYVPGKDILYKMDKYHQYEPPHNLSNLQKKDLMKYATDAGTVPPVPPNDPSNKDLSNLYNKYKAYPTSKNNLINNKNDFPDNKIYK